MDLLVVLQTHSRGDSQSYLNKQRFCQTPKSQLLIRCLYSLVRSLVYAKKMVPHLSLEFMVYDDHSDDITVKMIKETLFRCPFKTQFRSLETKGIMPSILACYQYGYNYGKEWVYFAQDDYLFDQKAIFQMVSVSDIFSHNLRMPVSIYPFNDPFRYEPQNIGEKVNIVRGCDRHWRTNYHTASCFMTHINVIRMHWDLFWKFGNTDLKSSMEDETINQLFISRGEVLFTPIPSLALHMQYDTEFDPFIDWKLWWDSFGQPIDEVLDNFHVNSCNASMSINDSNELARNDL